MVINNCNEVYGACRHRPQFRRFDQSQIDANASTDESGKDERVPSSTTSMESTCSTSSVD